MANLSLPVRAEPAAPSLVDTVLVASFGDPAAVDLAEQVTYARTEVMDLTQPTQIARMSATLPASGISTCILLIKTPWTDAERRGLEALIPLLNETTYIAILSTFRVHLDDPGAMSAEAAVLAQLQRLAARKVVFRPGHLVSRHSRCGRRLRWLGFTFPLVPRRLRSCFVGAGMLVAAIEQECQAGRGRRPVTLFGPNRPWRDVLREGRFRGAAGACLTCVAWLLALLMVGQVGALLASLLARWRPSLRHRNFHTIRPRSLAELLSICNRHNSRFVKVVGYNNGVVHFGQRFPGKTVISTVGCNRIVRTGPDVIKADCGTTIRQATDFLAAAGQELHVLPNYSYVCLGTAFFVPIHGSAADYSTVADTIVKVLLYDPDRDCFLLSTREGAAFREHVFNLGADVVVLRLWVRVKPKAQYFVRREERTNATGEQLLAALRDPKASNVEIRKSKAASDSVRISYYFSKGDGAALAFPRDALGRLWDRLEENALTSFLMHAATRHFAWHVELFFTAEEFVRFWAAHQGLPLRKLQLRYIRRDGMPHSPFRDEDCVAVDLFMLRWKRMRFETYLKQHFSIIRTNPGKHSQ
jgi:hypothetical protein